MQNARRVVFTVQEERLKPTRIRLQRLAEQGSNADKKAFFDDYCLIEAALSTDHTIISRDDVARCFFSRSAWSIGELEKVMWLNPEEELHSILVWLDEAPLERHRTLKAHRCPKQHGPHCASSA